MLELNVLFFLNNSIIKDIYLLESEILDLLECSESSLIDKDVFGCLVVSEKALKKRISYMPERFDYLVIVNL